MRCQWPSESSQFWIWFSLLWVAGKKVNFICGNHLGKTKYACACGPSAPGCSDSWIMSNTKTFILPNRLVRALYPIRLSETLQKWSLFQCLGFSLSWLFIILICFHAVILSLELVLPWKISYSHYFYYAGCFILCVDAVIIEWFSR